MNLLDLESVFKDIFTQKNISVDQGKKILQSYNSDDFKKYIRFDTQTYARNYVVNSELFDILILCWSPGQKTPMHWHPKDGCFVKILEWSIRETIYNWEKQVLKKNIHTAWDIMYNHDSIWYHVLENPNDTGTISLHIYSPWNYKPTKI